MVKEEIIARIWNGLYAHIQNPYGVAGLMGNLYAESGLYSNNLQNSYANKLGMTDAEYTKAVDSGEYTDFADDKAGYGLAQWTYYTRKQNLHAFAIAIKSSIGDLDMQIAYLCLELCNYSEVLRILRNATSIREASDAVVEMFEKPARITEQSKTNRANFGQIFYDEMSGSTAPKDCTLELPVLKRGSKGNDVKKLQQTLMDLGYNLPNYGSDGSYGKETAAAVKKFQEDNLLHRDGIAGAVTRYLINLNSETPPFEQEHLYTVTISHLDEASAKALFDEFDAYPVVLEEES